MNTVFDRDYEQDHLFEEFSQLVIQGMSYDYSWNYPGKEYLKIYEYISHK